MKKDYIPEGCDQQGRMPPGFREDGDKRAPQPWRDVALLAAGICVGWLAVVGLANVAAILWRWVA